MTNLIPAVELIEHAQRETPVCPCGAPTAPVARPGGVWLTCVSRSQPRPLVRRLLSLDLAFGHTHQRIADLSRLEVAA